MRGIEVRAKTLMLAAGLVAGGIALGGCPTNPTCPECTIKKGQYKIPKYKELDQGYSITDVAVGHHVTYESHCPNPPQSDDPPCQRSAKASWMPANPGVDEEKSLILETNWDLNDRETAEVTVTMEKRGAPTLSTTVSVTVVE